jgi:hypothetical protein
LLEHPVCGPADRSIIISVVGQGATFSFTLPEADDGAAD